MSGHSKWSTIKRRKEKSDSVKAKIFTKIGREIFVAVKSGGPDISSNFRLREVVSKAKANNVPGSNIERMIKKAAGDKSEKSFDRIIYEGYGPAGVAVLVDVLTDNKNRTASNVRHYFDKCGGKLGVSGCVGFMFDEKGVIFIDVEGADENIEEKLIEDCSDVDASDVEIDDDVAKVTCESAKFFDVKEGLEKLGYKILQAEVEQVPNSVVKLNGEEDGKNMESLIELLEDDDDVQKVWTNLQEE